MPGLKFDPTFGWTHVFSAIGLLIMIIGIYATITQAIGTVSGAQAAQETRILLLETATQKQAELSLKVNSLEQWRPTVDTTLERGRAERLAFQAESQRMQQQILEKLSAITADIAAIKASQAVPNTLTRSK